MTTAPTRPLPERTSRQPRLLPAAMRGTLAAMAAGVAVWLVAVPLAGVDLVTAHGMHIGIVAVLIVTLLMATAGFGLLALLARRRTGVRVWTTVAALVLLVSLLGPLSGATVAAAITLLCLHLTVGLTVILMGRLGVRRLR